ncbi:MAG: hypothetical protein EKK62_04020 [Acidimicrobiia bacterium]|nr:MAG: hypothetical protein EKK62_04020 [Acidimicrobiia bacterium]
MPDQRSALERRLDDVLGPPLYYCSDCLRACKVRQREGREPEVARACGQDCGHQIIAPRKSILAGEGGLNIGDRVTVQWWQLAAKITGRCV